MKHRFVIEHPLDLGRTLRGTSLWGGTTWQRADASGGWYAERTPDGPATVCLARDGDDVLAEAWGPGAASLMDRVPGLLGEHDDPSAFEPDHHPLVRELARRSVGFRLGRTYTLFPRLVSAILGQRVTGKQGKSALRSIAWRWGEQAPGPREDLRLLPSADTLASTPYYAFHPLGVERNRAATVIRVARHARWLERSVNMSFELAHRRLQHIPGIGPWTSGVVVSLALGDPDSLPIGDYNLPSMIAWNLAGEARADDDRMLELLAPWTGQRGRVARMVKGGGRKAPRFGPRVEIFDITKA